MSEAQSPIWEQASLSEYATIKGGKRLPKGEQFATRKTEHPYIRVSDFENGTISLSELRYVTSEIRDQITRYIINSNDLYISIAGTLGLVGEVPESLNGALLTENAAKIVFKDSSQSDKRYFKYLLNADEAQYHFSQAKGTGGGVPKLALFRIEDTPVCSPPLLEQKKIAAILTSVDNVIEKTQAQIDKLNNLKTGMMQELLTKGIGPDGKPHTQFKDSPVGRIPVGWEVTELDELAMEGAPICYGILMPGNHVENGIPVIKVKDIRKNRIDESNLLLTSKEIDDKYQRSKVTTGDILITIRGTTGRLARIPPALNGANITQDSARVRIEDKSLAEFVFICLQAPAAQKYVEDNTIGQAVKGINLAELRKLLVKLPPVNERSSITRIMNNLQSKLNTKEKILQKQKNAKKALMQDLLTGKVRVTPDPK